MTENRNADQQGPVEERSAVGDFIYQVGTDATSAAIGGAVVMGAKAVVKKVTGGGKSGNDSGSSE
jgi:hypothetical protein